MTTNHFAFVTSDSGPGQTKMASDRLELLGNIAAKRYLQERVPLNTSIKKIAQENDLNGEQIKRICEMANIATHKGLWSKTAEKESVAFDLADARNLATVSRPPTPDDEDAGCGCGGSPCGCGMTASPSSVDSDYNAPPKGIPAPGPSIMSMMGADPAKVHHGLGPEPEKKRIIIMIQKKAHERKTLADDIVYKGMELETLEKKAYHAVKQTILGGSSFSQVFEAAVGAGLGKVANDRLPQYQDALIKETHGEIHNRLVKCAIQKAPDDLISSNLGNVTVINGAHPVMISLDTVQRKTGEIKNGISNLLRIDDEVKIYTQRLRELS